MSFIDIVDIFYAVNSKHIKKYVAYFYEEKFIFNNYHFLEMIW